MKIKKIVAAVLMMILSLSGVVIMLLASLKVGINPIFISRYCNKQRVFKFSRKRT